MNWNSVSLRRGLLAVLLLLNLFAPIQKVLACISLDDRPMPMDMACCPEAVPLGDSRYADIEQRILNGDSCCVLELTSTAQDVSTQHHHYAESALKQVADVAWLVLPTLLNAPVLDSASGDAPPPPHEPLAALAGTETYADTARLRI
ncbi:MAG: hypothetical protein HYV16_07175 [Gammaproteobacteria bacterium]|nr:hypothetical protein [Gammaproteobacteria bacterium]